jgi:hypothetical protein
MLAFNAARVTTVRACIDIFILVLKNQVSPPSRRKKLIPWAHNKLQLIEIFTILRKPNFHRRIYKMQRNIEPYYDLFLWSSHLLVEDYLLLVIWTSTHFCIGFPICIISWTTSTKIMLYALTMHETDSPRLILLDLITTIILGVDCVLINWSLCNYLLSPPILLRPK